MDFDLTAYYVLLPNAGRVQYGNITEGQFPLLALQSGDLITITFPQAPAIPANDEYDTFVSIQDDLITLANDFPHTYALAYEPTDVSGGGQVADLNYTTTPAGTPLQPQYQIQETDGTLVWTWSVPEDHPAELVVQYEYPEVSPVAVEVELEISNPDRTTAPPPPPHFTPDQKTVFQNDAATLSKLANVLSDLGASTDPLNPVLKLEGTFAGQLANAIDPQVGTVNSTIQTALSVTSIAIKAIDGTVNPIGLTCFLAAKIDQLAAQLLKILANDPADGNFTTVYQAPDWSFGTITGASTTANTFVTDSWKLLQDAANALAASERYQGAEFAGDTASQALQNTAFNNAVTAYDAQRQVVSTDLNAYLTELQTSVSDINLTNDTSFVSAQAYLNGLHNPLTDDPFLAGFIASINSTAPYLSSAINGDVQQAITAFESEQAPALTGSAFSAIGSAAGQLAVPVLTSTSVQQEVLGLYMALYNRAADFPGYSYWVGIDGQQSDSGGVTVANASTTAVTLPDAAVLGQSFVNTQNTFFNSLYAALNDNQFVNALYVNIGGNAGDPGGIAYWAALLAQAEAGGMSVQAARAGLVGQFVHDLVGIDLTPGAAALGLTTDQYNAALARQAAIDDKIAVSLAFLNASQQPGGGILVAQSVGDAAYNAAVTVLQSVTSDPATVTAAIVGINNAVAHQDLTLI